VDGQWVDYSRPQANGNKTGVRWAALTDEKGHGLLISSMDAPLSIDARHYSTQTMRESDYNFKMERSEDIFLNIDAGQSGVGGINSWGAKPLDKHRLLEKTYNYTYRLLPVTGNVEKALSTRAEFTTSNVETLAAPDVSKLPEITAPQDGKKKRNNR
jgi:beta-galactosidase